MMPRLGFGGAFRILTECPNTPKKFTLDAIDEVRAAESLETLERVVDGYTIKVEFRIGRLVLSASRERS